MTDTTREPPRRARTPQVTFGDTLVRTMKLLSTMKHHTPRAHPEVDPIAYPILFNLWCQPVRVSELAEKVYADVSTVSRQVTHLVGLGLIERVPDPEDGRAHSLSLTEAGATLLIDRAAAARGLASPAARGLVGHRPRGLHRLSRPLRRRRRALRSDAGAHATGRPTDPLLPSPTPHTSGTTMTAQPAAPATRRGGPHPSPDPDDPHRPDAGDVPRCPRPDHRRDGRSGRSPTTSTASTTRRGRRRHTSSRRRSPRRSTASSPTSTAGRSSSSPPSRSSSSAPPCPPSPRRCTSWRRTAPSRASVPVA